MSDAVWDNEYRQAEEMKEEIKEYCVNNNLRIPVMSEYARTWELEKILDELKNRPKDSGTMGDFDTPRMSRLPDADLVE